MTASLLVATPHAAFGELLRISLEESGLYQVRQVLSAKEARACAARSQYKLAILDSDLTDEPFISLCYDLIGQMCIMVIPPENNPNHPSLGGLIPHGYLNRPFYLPDLLETVHRLVDPKEDSAPPPAATKPEWVNHPQILQNLLDQQLQTCDAVGILIGGQGSLLGCAGLLSKESADEMAAILLRYWDPNEKTDLMRFVRLSSTKGDYLVYATGIVSDLVLFMVYEPGSQLSQVRPQTRQIAQNLASVTVPVPPPEPNVLPPNVTLIGSSNGHTDASKKTAIPAAIEPDTEPVEEDDGMYSADGESFLDKNGLSQNYGEDLANISEIDDDMVEGGKFDLSLLLGAIPSPDPGATIDSSLSSMAGSSSADLLSGWFTEEEWSDGTAGSELEEEALPIDQTEPEMAWPSHEEEIGEEPAVLNTPTTDNEPPEKTTIMAVEEDMVTRPILRRTLDPAAPSATVPMLNLPEPEINPLEDTKPKVVTTITNVNQLEPVSPALSLLNYTCVLLPRLPHHYLTGELADRLAQWVQQLCVAFGWRLEGISLRPEYLQWTVQVAPSVSPGNLVRIIRQRSSVNIFNTFEQIKLQNPSGDFWATGYLIVSGPQPPSAQLLREYIAQTRRRQGIQKA